MFESGDLHVGVVMGGYGAGAILAALREADGIEAKAMHQLSAEHLGACDVVVVPQRLSGQTASFGEAPGGAARVCGPRRGADGDP